VRRWSRVPQSRRKMLDPRIPFKNRYLAGVFALLIPGAGHLYQGRRFKGIVCGLCVLGTFFFGMEVGDWGVVYWKRDPLNMLNPFYAQFFVGLPAWTSLIQSHRYQSRDNIDQAGIDAPLDAPFTGTLRMHDPLGGIPNGEVTGRISIKPDAERSEGRTMHGEFVGTITSKKGPTQDIKLALGDVPRLGKPVMADPERGIELEVVDAGKTGRLRGSIPRSFWDRFEAPPDDDDRDLDRGYLLELHRQLGKFYELSMTFTMIAGLLNILVILDAVQGPAYGYGDSETKEGPQQNAASAPVSGVEKPSPTVVAKAPDRVATK
jgi:hypothetical protein